MVNKMNCRSYEACSMSLMYVLLAFLDLTLRYFSGIPIILNLLTNRNVASVGVQRKSVLQSFHLGNSV